VCKIDEDEGIECGVGVRCTGGCTGSYSDPVCESELTPPSCQVDSACLAACSAKAIAQAICEPTQIDVLVDLTIAPELEPLVATLEVNLPILVDAAEARGRLMLAATERLADAGERFGDRIEDVNGKSLACVGAASTSIAKLIGSLRVSVEASARLDVMLETHTL
jgi:hypothetical protein